MNIKRIVNGVEFEFELTDSELEQAYREQEYNYACAEIDQAVAWMNENDFLCELNADDIIANPKLVKEIYESYMDILCDDDLERWERAIQKHVRC